MAAALGAACGIAAAALWPIMGSTAWGILHSLIAVAVVLLGGYTVFERAMKGFIAVMFLCMVGSAVWLGPDWSQLTRGVLLPSIPADAGDAGDVVGGVADEREVRPAGRRPRGRASHYDGSLP